MRGQFCILNEAITDVVGASDDPQELQISIVFGIPDQHTHFPADALEPYGRGQDDNIRAIGFATEPPILQGINGGPSEHRGKTPRYIRALYDQN
jgi:hypothetical protein